MIRKNLIILLTASFIALFSVGIANSQSNYGDSYRSDVEEQKKLDKIRLELLKQRVENIRREIKAKNKKFRVDVTEAIKYKIKEITGLKLPRGLQREARIQSNLGERLFRLFLRGCRTRKKAVQQFV